MSVCACTHACFLYVYVCICVCACEVCRCLTLIFFYTELHSVRLVPKGLNNLHLLPVTWQNMLQRTSQGKQLCKVVACEGCLQLVSG